MTPQDVRELALASAAAGAGLTVLVAILAVAVRCLIQAHRDATYWRTHVRNSRTIRPGVL